MYKQTSIIGATFVIAAILTTGLLLTEALSIHYAYARGLQGGGGDRGIILGGGGHGTGSSTNFASNSVVISGYVLHHHIHLRQSIIQSNSIGGGLLTYTVK